MYIEKVPNRGSKPTILLRESWREGKKIIKRTVANLSSLSSTQIEEMKRVLKNEPLLITQSSFEIIRSYHHGSIFAVLTAMRKLNFQQLVSSRQSKERDLVTSMVASRIINPCSKLALGRWWENTTLPQKFPIIENTNEDDLYGALDWLFERQKHIEKKLAHRHLEEGNLVLYDLSSSYFEGDCCPIAEYGYSRDKKRGKKQINYGLLTDRSGCPISIEVFPGNTKDCTTLPAQIKKVRTKFHLEKIVIVGDRGMVTQKQIDEFKNMEGIYWVTALKNQQIQILEEKNEKKFKRFRKKDLFEMRSVDFPNERLIVCRNEKLSQKRRFTRNSLIEKTSEKLNHVQDIVKEGKLAGKDKIGVRIGREINKFKMAKLFELKINNKSFSFSINKEKLEQEEKLDGIYIIRTNLPKTKTAADEVVRTYKKLCQVERAFRSMKTMDLKVRPIYHYSENRVKAHVFLCMLAYYVEWHMKEVLRPLLFSDEEIHLKDTRNPVSPAQPSNSSKKKAKTKKLKDGNIVHSFNTLMNNLNTIVLNVCKLKQESCDKTFTIETKPNKTQKIALKLLDSIVYPVK